MTQATYRPQTHAQDMADQAEALREIKRSMAIMMGHLERLEAGQVQLVALVQDRAAKRTADPALDALVTAAYECLGGAVWTLQDLLIAASGPTEAGDRLSVAVSSIGKGNARSVGRLLAASVPQSYMTPDGLELRRCGIDRNAIAWTIAQA